MGCPVTPKVDFSVRAGPARRSQRARWNWFSWKWLSVGGRIHEIIKNPTLLNMAFSDCATVTQILRSGIAPKSDPREWKCNTYTNLSTQKIVSKMAYFQKMDFVLKLDCRSSKVYTAPRRRALFRIVMFLQRVENNAFHTTSASKSEQSS